MSRLIFRSGVMLRSPAPQPQPEPPSTSPANYQGLRYSRYGVRYTL